MRRLKINHSSSPPGRHRLLNRIVSLLKSKGFPISAGNEKVPGRNLFLPGTNSIVRGATLIHGKKTVRLTRYNHISGK